MQTSYILNYKPPIENDNASNTSVIIDKRSGIEVLLDARLF
jgi:hypothetical protein